MRPILYKSARIALHENQKNCRSSPLKLAQVAGSEIEMKNFTNPGLGKTGFDEPGPEPQNAYPCLWRFPLALFACYAMFAATHYYEHRNQSMLDRQGHTWLSDQKCKIQTPGPTRNAGMIPSGPTLRWSSRTKRAEFVYVPVHHCRRGEPRWEAPSISWK